MIGHAEAAGARSINGDRMWHYTEGIANWDPIWPNHGIRILLARPPSGSTPMAIACRRLACRASTVLRRCGISASSVTVTAGSSPRRRSSRRSLPFRAPEQNPDLTGRDIGLLLRSRLGRSAPPPVEAFKAQGRDFIVAETLEELVAGMNRIGDHPLDLAHLRSQIEARDRELDNPFAKDAQIVALRQARSYLGDRFMRTAPPHRILDAKAGPLIAVRLNILTRKSLGGLETDLNSQALDRAARPYRDCMLAVRRRALAAVDITATMRWKARSWEDAFSPAARRGGQREPVELTAPPREGVRRHCEGMQSRRTLQCPARGGVQAGRVSYSIYQRFI